MAATKLHGRQIKAASIALAALGADIIDNGKLASALLPASVVGAMVYQGAYDASTTNPPAAASSGNQGHYYIISVAGTIATVDYQIGDWIISNGTGWDKIDNTEATETAATTSYDNATSGLTATTVQAALDELAAKSPAEAYVRETPAGAVDGVNAEFTLANTPATGTAQVYLNGLLQEPTDDYTLAGTTITFVEAPQTGDKVRAIYWLD